MVRNPSVLHRPHSKLFLMLDLSPAIHCNTFLDIFPPTPLSIGLEFSQKPHPISSADWLFLLELKATSGWDFDLRPAMPYLKGKTKAIVVTDPTQHITWVSQGFTRMTGYEKQEAYGRHPRFLQGEKTQIQTRHRIRQHLNEGQSFSGTIVNYRKSGEAYACAIDLFPVYNHNHNLVNFIALEKEESMEYFLN